eukprot:2390990-Pleurochrysis_carterae.AAC.1
MGRGKRVEHVLCDFPEPTADQCVVRVTAINGGNLVSASDANGMSYLCRIPAKYHNVFWVKIGARRCLASFHEGSTFHPVSYVSDLTDIALRLMSTQAAI